MFLQGHFCDKQRTLVPETADGTDTVTIDQSNSARITGLTNKICLSEVTQLSEG